MADRAARLAACASLMVLAVASVCAAADPQTAADLLVLADRPNERYREAVLHVKATVSTAKKTEEPAEFEVYRKGHDKTLVVFTVGKQKGRKLLTAGDKSWLIVPGSSRAIPVTPNQRLLGGASMGDVARLTFSENFSGTLALRPEEVGDVTCDVLDLKARSTASVYGSGTLWIDREEHLPRKVVLALASGKPSKELLFEKYGLENGEPVVLEMSIRDLVSGALRLTTKLEYSHYRRTMLPDSLFTPEGAQGLATGYTPPAARAQMGSMDWRTSL